MFDGDKSSSSREYLRVGRESLSYYTYSVLNYASMEAKDVVSVTHNWVRMTRWGIRILGTFCKQVSHDYGWCI